MADEDDAPPGRQAGRQARVRLVGGQVLLGLGVVVGFGSSTVATAGRVQRRLLLLAFMVSPCLLVLVVQAASSSPCWRAPSCPGTTGTPPWCERPGPTCQLSSSRARPTRSCRHTGEREPHRTNEAAQEEEAAGLVVEAFHGYILQPPWLGW